MKKFWQLKKIWLIFLVLLIAGLFIYFIWSPEKESIPKEIKESEEIKKETNIPISSIYRYDYEKKEYVKDNGKSWQNKDLTRYIYDLAPEGSQLDSCYYFTYNNTEKSVVNGGQRECNSNLTITVGEDKNCFFQGENSCALYVYAVDTEGKQGKIASVTYNIDFEKPLIGKPYTKGNESYPLIIEKKETINYKAIISDNTELNYCWFYLDGEEKEMIRIKPFCKENCLVSLDYVIEEGGIHNVLFRCADHFDTERGEYLNLAYGEATEVLISVNQPPEISFCKVFPNQGNIQTGFQFQIEASDLDNDSLFFLWDFGDGESSDEKNPVHFYKTTGTFEPKVTVFDNKEGEGECFTAWVVVSD